MIYSFKRLFSPLGVLLFTLISPCAAIDWASFDFSAKYDEPPIAVITVKPDIPADASVNGRTELLLAVLVNVDGKVNDVVILEDDISPEVIDAVVEAVSQNRYEPAKYEGKPVEIWYMISIPITWAEEDQGKDVSPDSIIPKGLEKR